MDDVLTPNEVAAYAGVSLATVYNWQDYGDMRGHPYGPPFTGHATTARLNAGFCRFVQGGCGAPSSICLYFSPYFWKNF